MLSSCPGIVDGYVAGVNDQPDNLGGDGFMRLHEWYGFGLDTGPTADSTAASGRKFLDEITMTGVVLWSQHRGAGRSLGRRPPRRRPDLRGQSPAAGAVGRTVPLGDLRDGRDRQRDDTGKAAAGERNVLVHGAYTAQTALERAARY